MNLVKIRKLIKNTKAINGVFLDNPILKFGLALPFVVAGSTNITTAWVLSIGVVVTVIPISFIAYLVGDKVAKHIQYAIYPIIAMIILVPYREYVYTSSPAIADSLGIYLYLLAASSLLISQSEHSCARKRPLIFSLIKSLSTCVGFAVIILIVGAMREVLSMGTFIGKEILFFDFRLYGVSYIFFGFITLGFLMAAAKLFKRVVYATFTREED